MHGECFSNSPAMFERVKSARRHLHAPCHAIFNLLIREIAEHNRRERRNGCLYELTRHRACIHQAGTAWSEYPLVGSCYKYVTAQLAQRFLFNTDAMYAIYT